MKKFTILLILAINFTAFAQTNYEKGYYLTNTDEKVYGYILNNDWNKTPTEFNFKKNLEEDEQIISINNAKLFSIENKKKYERFTVAIDTSKTGLGNIDYDRNPKFKEFTVYLEKLVEGPANLYSNNSTNTNNKYFFSLGTSLPSQLVYKEYLVNINGALRSGENSYYKQQLFNNLKCESIELKDANSLDYKERSLIKFFNNYNNCKDSNYSNYYKKEENKGAIALTVRPGLTYSSITFEYENRFSDKFTEELDSKLGYRIGIEFEYILPFNNNKWGLLFEPVYTSYSSEVFLEDTEASSFLDTRQNVEAEYNALGLQIGLRHYFYINEKSSIFANIAYYQQFSAPNSTLDFQKTKDFGFHDSSNNFAIGAGYNFNRKFSLEINYIFKREVFEQVSRSAKLDQLSVILGYNIF